MISVLMRSHNDIKYIRQTVEALLAQDVDESVEIISCDDHSTDGTAEYLASVPELRHILPFRRVNMPEFRHRGCVRLFRKQNKSIRLYI